MLAKGEWPKGEEYLYTAYQTAGRGQAGNGWESEEGKNLLCSIAVESRKTASLKVESPFYLNVLISVAVHRMINCQLSILNSQLTIKWPNDIYWKDKKIAGILIENAILGNEVQYSVAGIGLNVNQTQFVSNAPNPVSMKLVSGEEYGIDAVMNALMDEIHEVQKMPSDEVWAYYRAHLYRREGEWPFAEREVSIAPSRVLTERPDKCFMASIEEITENGELVLRTDTGTRAYHFKEIQFVL
jgi:BirA family biotin operon repressor/biotin-[acetyl-CoA-carboxylase] ligase